MASKNFLNNLTIPSPCNADWNSMKGNDQSRFCAHCNLDVHNLSQMTHRQAQRLVNKSQGRLCVQFLPGPNGPRTLPLVHKIHRLGRRASRLAAGAFTATLSVTSAVAQSSLNSPASNLNPPSATQSALRLTTGGSIVGTVTDQNGAVIPGATVFVSNGELQISLYTSTNNDGQFRIDSLQQGIYSVRIEAPGFVPEQIAELYVAASGDARVEKFLRVAGLEETVDIYSESSSETVVLGGAMSVIQPENPFIRAAQEDNLEKLTDLIAGMDVNLRDEVSHTTALEHAVGNANREMVQLLLSAGANVNARNDQGQTVLMMLDEDATSDLIWDLVNAGAQVNLKDQNGNTALMQAASDSNLEAIKTLFDAGAEVDARNDKGETALMLAASDGDVTVVRALVLAGADISAHDEDDNTALSLSQENNHSAVFRFLKSKGAIETVALKKKDE